MTTDTIADREGKNFCEEWKPAAAEAKTDNAEKHRDKFDSLFGD
jgi:hypothetical protein